MRRSQSFQSLALGIVLFICPAVMFAATIGPISFFTNADYENTNPPLSGLFRDFVSGHNINRGDDNFTQQVSALNFNPPSGTSGTDGLALYDANPTNATPSLFRGSIRLSTDLIEFGTNANQPGLLTLFNEGAGQFGLALTLQEAGNTDHLVLHKVPQSGDIKTGGGANTDIASLLVNNVGINDDIWFRLTMDLTVSGNNLTVVGKVFAHSNPDDPVGSQLGGTFTHTDTLTNLGLNASGIGEVGLIFDAGANTSRASFTNFSINVPAILSESPSNNGTLDFGNLPMATIATQLVTLGNIGTTGSVIDVASASFGGANPSMFVIDAGFVPGTLTAGGLASTQNYTIKFLGANLPGTYLANVNFSTSEGPANYSLMAVVVPEPDAGFTLMWGAFLAFSALAFGRTWN